MPTANLWKGSSRGIQLWCCSNNLKVIATILRLLTILMDRSALLRGSASWPFPGIPIPTASLWRRFQPWNPAMMLLLTTLRGLQQSVMVPNITLLKFWLIQPEFPCSSGIFLYRFLHSISSLFRRPYCTSFEGSAVWLYGARLSGAWKTPITPVWHVISLEFQDSRGF